MQSIKKERLVAASQAVAFNVFVDKIDTWWPRTHHIGKTPMVELMIEPKVNGRWFSKHEDGSEETIGYVMQYNPYGLLLLAWQVDANFKFDAALVTEVELRFIEEGPAITRVLMEHRHLERMADGAKIIASMDNGWGMILDLYKTKAETI